MSEAQYLTGDKDAINGFLDKFDVFLFDCDGVLWSGDHVFPETIPTLNMLREKGKQLVFVSNNSTKARADYKKKFDSLGITVEVDEVFGSAYSAAIYISRIVKLPAPKNKVFVLGEAGITAELDSENVPWVGGPDPNLRRDWNSSEDFAAIASGRCLDPDVGIVLAGLDTHVNYLKLSIAHAYLLRGALFLATNLDSTLPASQTFFLGAGSVVAPLTNAVGKEPLALGKPSQAMMEAVQGKFHFDKARTCMVGDRLNTDIQFGRESKLGGTLAVLTGVMKKEDFMGADKTVVPHAYVDKLGDLLG